MSNKREIASSTNGCFSKDHGLLRQLFFLIELEGQVSGRRHYDKEKYVREGEFLLRPSSQEIMRKLNTDYIDAELKDLSYDHANHLVQLSYGDYGQNESEGTISFKDCFSATFNTWLEGMKGSIPQKPGELGFFFHEITIEDIEINGILLYKCSLVIPMMDCQITCVTIEINN